MLIGMAPYLPEVAQTADEVIAKNIAARDRRFRRLMSGDIDG